MINTHTAKLYCKDDISLIENYDKAIYDTMSTWDCHHRDEIRILHSGMTVIRSLAELKENGRYYNCPANELIFLTRSEHMKLHKVGMNNPMYGKHHSNETKAKISATRTGKKFSDEAKRKMSEAKKGKNKGKKISEETRRKMSESRRAYWANRNKCYLLIV